MNYFKYQEHYLFTRENEPHMEAMRASLPDIRPVSREEAYAKADLLHFLFRHDPSESKSCFALTDPTMLQGTPEGLHNLRESSSCQLLAERRVRAVNTAIPDFAKNFGPEHMIYSKKNESMPAKKRVHILALGDVGGILLLGLKLMGGHVISEIGIYDISPALVQRMEYEMNQMHDPNQPDHMPSVVPVKEDELFDCDVFIFCASKGVPPLGADVRDVRLVQYEGNKEIITRYARMADEKKFKGIFAVVSDPVDHLCRAALLENGKEGAVPRQNLRPEQIKGYGLGVMNSRGLYYAKRDERFESFLTKGRCFGPHGKGLVLVNDITCYEPTLSDELTELALHANLRTRETGFKPYLAPAISSGAISIILTLEGNWHYSANFVGGVYMGARNRIVPAGLEIESVPMPDILYEKLLQSYGDLKQAVL